MRFSETGKKKYFDSLRKNQRNSNVPVKRPRCFDCNSGGRQEMECGMCGQTKSLNHFSKAARRKGDNPVSLEKCWFTGNLTGVLALY